MKIRLSCPDCAASNAGTALFFLETIQDDGLYTGKCPKGHDLLVATQTLRYEMLFEIALNAINDGYYREAVSSFMASVERYYEFAVRVISKKNKVRVEVLADAWKLVAAQSERQFGAYMFAYIGAFNEMPSLKIEDKRSTRNNVIHNGKLPDKTAAMDFGRAAYEVIQSGIQKLRAECLNEVNEALKDHLAEIIPKISTRYPRTFQSTPTALNVIADISSGYKSFDQMILEWNQSLV